MGKFVITTTKSGEFRFRLKAKNAPGAQTAAE